MHGFPDDHRIYNKLLPRLAPRRAVAFDFLGYGRSDRTNAARFCPQHHGVQVTAVLNELGITSAVLVGHDASGPDAVLYAVAHPERVAHLVLLNTIFGRQKSLKMPEMTRLRAEPELASLADDMVNDPDQRLWLLQRWAFSGSWTPMTPAASRCNRSSRSSSATPTSPTPSPLSGPGQRACSTRWRNRTPSSTAEHFATSRSQSRSSLAKETVT
jgi:pimeloyl-ACP methyl ester carboxylesterase